MGILQVCKLQEQLETTMQKLEESKQLLKTNENGRSVQSPFSHCNNDVGICLLLQVNGSSYSASPVCCCFVERWLFMENKLLSVVSTGSSGLLHAHSFLWCLG